MKKICNKCEIEKPLSDFFKDKNNKTDGRYSICRSCKDLSTNEWRKKNREKYNADMRAYNALYRDKRRGIDLKRKYGVTLGEYEQRLAEQGNVCAICEKPNSSKKRCFAMDHDHKTGLARGVLCYGCNRALHTLEEDGLLDKAKAYLKKWSKP